MSVTIKYKGNTIASANTDTTKTIKTSGKYCEADIVVENTNGGGATITDGIVVKARDTDGWTEIDASSEDEDANEADYKSALAELGVSDE